MQGGSLRGHASPYPAGEAGEGEVHGWLLGIKDSNSTQSLVDAECGAGDRDIFWEAVRGLDQ